MNSDHRPTCFLEIQRYQGSTTDLVIGIDVGTTFSGVSYAILRPNTVPKVQQVTKFTDQHNGDAKIPSIMYFDKDMNLKAVGASAVTETTRSEAEGEGWNKVEYFKMHLRPSDMRIDTNGLALGTLPAEMTPVDAMGHFLRYLHKETVQYIETLEPLGADLIKSFGNRISFVLSHPNGWDGPQQQRMREAAVFGGLIQNDTDGHARLKFVTEGEASALACLDNGLCPPDLQPGYRFMIADCGGGTFDITTYEITQTSPLRLKELTCSACCFAGGVFVNREMYKLLKERLCGAHYDNPEELDELVNKNFEESIKREFKDGGKALWMQIGPRSENDLKLGIRRGSLKIEGYELEKCFQFSVDSLVKTIESQLEACRIKAIPVWLVGGFANSPWLFTKINDALKKRGISVSRPDSNLNLAKAVANGNVLYALDNTVAARRTKAAYGFICSTLFNFLDPEHIRRSHLCFEDLEGDIMMPFYFNVIVDKGEEVQESEKLSCSYTLQRPAFLVTETTHECTLIRYKGPTPVPEWYDENKDSFFSTCTIKADLSRLLLPEKIHTYRNRRYWSIDLSVEMSFGKVEVQAQLKWKENGAIKYGPATIFYEDE